MMQAAVHILHLWEWRSHPCTSRSTAAISQQSGRAHLADDVQDCDESNKAQAHEDHNNLRSAHTLRHLHKCLHSIALQPSRQILNCRLAKADLVLSEGNFLQFRGCKLYGTYWGELQSWSVIGKEVEAATSTSALSCC